MCSPETDLTLGTAVAATHPVLGVFVHRKKTDTFADTPGLQREMGTGDWQTDVQTHSASTDLDRQTYELQC